MFVFRELKDESSVAPLSSACIDPLLLYKLFTNMKAMTNYKVVFDYSYGILRLTIHQISLHRAKPFHQEESWLNFNNKPLYDVKPI